MEEILKSIKKGMRPPLNQTSNASLDLKQESFNSQAQMQSSRVLGISTL